MWLFVLLIVVPIVEIALFIEVGGWIGLWPTIGIVILTAVIGAALLRRQGLAALAELEARVRRGEDPRGPILHGLLILVAGIVLLTPGFFTDAVGFALLVPAARQALITQLGRRIVVASMAAQRARAERRGPGAGAPPTEPPARDQVIETEYEDVSDPPPGGRGRPSGWTRAE